MKKITVLLLGMLFAVQANAQDKTPINNPPVNVEALVANQGIYLQTIAEEWRASKKLYLSKNRLTRGDYAFGIGGNLDYFGPNAERVENIGVFGTVNLF